MKLAFELRTKFKKLFTLQWTVSKILLLLYFVFLFYVTFKPFNFKPVWGIFKEQFHYFWNTISFFKETVSGTKSDVIANIIVFIPFGSLLYWYKWEKNNFEKKINLFKGILIIFGTTALIEFGQLFLPTRHPSIVDIITNLTGGALGFIIVNMLVGSYKDFLYFINQLIHEKWDVKLFIVFVFIIFFYAWFPLSFSINMWQVKHHLKFFIYSPIQLMNMLNAIPYLILFFYLQLLILEIIEKYFTIKNILLKFFIAVSIVLAVSGIQFFGQSFIRGRLYNFEDLLMVFIGISAGTIFAYNLYLKKGLIFDKNNNYLLIILKITLLLNVIFILDASLFPFSWELKYSIITSKFKIALIPFNSYVGSITKLDEVKLYLLMDLAKDVFKFIPVTIVISAIYHIKGVEFKKLTYLGLFAAVFFLEFFQIFNKEFNPDISDVILGIISLYLGRRLWVLGKLALNNRDLGLNVKLENRI